MIYLRERWEELFGLSEVEIGRIFMEGGLDRKPGKNSREARIWEQLGAL